MRRFARLYQALDASAVFLAHALPAAPETFGVTLGAPAEWLVEWKYGGMRAQVVKREGRVWIWSRGEEFVSDRFQEVV